ncbi:RHS repeat-associated core domain-containing protein [uncultured Alloprevotella sp.]|uniref:RHS repeat domain-containing protein n=1 Tax=uncultured Alloprevotella sp. TaxID=1283315 RepID=UPI00325F9596
MRLVSQDLLLFSLLLIKGLIICSASLPVEERSNEHVIKRTYDKSGQIATLTSSLGADLTYERNEFGELTCFSAGQAEAPGRFESRHEYDSLGFELERMLPGGVTQSFAYDDIGRLIDSKTRQSSKVRRERKYHWGKADRLLKTEDNRFGTTTYEYSPTGHLQKAVYADGREEYRLSDKAGNLFDDPDRKLRKYLRGGKLEQSGEWRFVYDRDGQLVEKYKGSGKWWDSKSERWRYIWNQNGTLKEVRPPGGGDFAFDALFTYDALGRRLSKDAIGITCWLWNGNVPLHEWTPSQRRNEQREIEEYQKDLRTWLFEEECFVPLALFQDGKAYSIVTDHLGTPVEAYNEQGEEVWYRRLDMNGNVIEERSMNYTSYKDYIKIPFLFQGQYYDEEVKLAYNRFRYYAPELGRYISEDPIRFESGQVNLFTYVKDTNVWIDMLGLAQANGGNAPKHGNTGHNKAIDEHIQKLRSNPQVSEIRKNQQLVNYEGNVVGKNRPDIQYNRGGIHYTVEYDTKVSSSIKHQRQSPMLAPDARHTYWHIQSDGSKISGLSIREKNSTYTKK